MSWGPTAATDPMTIPSHPNVRQGLLLMRSGPPNDRRKTTDPATQAMGNKDPRQWFQPPRSGSPQVSPRNSNAPHMPQASVAIPSNQAMAIAKRRIVKFKSASRASGRHPARDGLLVDPLRGLERDRIVTELDFGAGEDPDLAA
jgi:hypothetical protein